MHPSPCPVWTCSLNVSKAFAEFGVVPGKVLIDIIMEVTCSSFSGKLWPHRVSWWKWCLIFHPGAVKPNIQGIWQRCCQCGIRPCACKGVISGMGTDQDPLHCSSKSNLNEHKLAPALNDAVLSFVLATGAGWPGSQWVQLRANPLRKGKKRKLNSTNSIPRSAPSIWLTMHMSRFLHWQCGMQHWKKPARGGRLADCWCHHELAPPWEGFHSL